MRTPEFIARCMAAGMPLDLALMAAKAFEAECELAVAEVLEARRAKERARQAKHREKSNACHVMSRNETLPAVLERDLTGERPQVVTPSLPSLRSEELKIPPEKPTVSTPKGADCGRGMRLPADWRPDELGLAYAVAQLGLNVDPERELDRFLDYWRAVPGAKGRKTDWPATWRNWVRRAAENLPRKAHERPDPDPKLTARHANYARAWEGSERAAGRDWKP